MCRITYKKNMSCDDGDNVNNDNVHNDTDQHEDDITNKITNTLFNTQRH